jgi:hypothetical protein
MRSTPWLSKRALVVLLVAACAALVARMAEPALPAAPRASAALSCGVERQVVKSLQDRPSLIPARRTTVAYLTSLARPNRLLSARLPFERHIFSITGSVTQVRPEADQDLHLVVRSGSKHMIVEAPDAPFCTGKATPLRKRQMASARKAARPCARAHIVGVAFWDYFHGQTGVAPNAIELHPVLGFACPGGTPPSPPPPPGGRCAASYPDECIPPPPPDLDCGDIPYRNFRVLWNVPDPDPHHFDGNRDGVGCEA